MVGLIDDLTKVCGQGWQAEGDLIYLLGVGAESTGNGNVTLGGSEYLKVIHQTVAGQPPKVDIALALKVQAACRHGIRQGWIRSAHDCAEGGLAIALAESCISGQKGAAITLKASQIRTDTLLFGEGGDRIVVAVAPSIRPTGSATVRRTCLIWQQIGSVAASAPLPFKTKTVRALISLSS